MLQRLRPTCGSPVRHTVFTEPSAIPMKDYLSGSFDKLSASGRRLPEHPIAQRLNWPRRYIGTRQDFVTFPGRVDPRQLLQRRGSVLTSRFNSGTLNRWVVPFKLQTEDRMAGVISRSCATSSA